MYKDRNYIIILTIFNIFRIVNVYYITLIAFLNEYCFYRFYVLSCYLIILYFMNSIIVNRNVYCFKFPKVWYVSVVSKRVRVLYRLNWHHFLYFMSSTKYERFSSMLFATLTYECAGIIFSRQQSQTRKTIHGKVVCKASWETQSKYTIDASSIGTL